jgi:Arc/MetJ-type ribon-helix-helix transcriptional regulator
MSTDTDGPNDGRMEKIDVRVPASVIEAIDEEYERRGYTSRSEAIRDALRDWLNPSVELTEETLADLERSRKQLHRGETRSLEDVAADYDVDIDEE